MAVEVEVGLKTCPYLWAICIRSWARAPTPEHPPDENLHYGFVLGNLSLSVWNCLDGLSLRATPTEALPRGAQTVLLQCQRREAKRALRLIWLNVIRDADKAASVSWLALHLQFWAETCGCVLARKQRANSRISVLGQKSRAVVADAVVGHTLPYLHKASELIDAMAAKQRIDSCWEHAWTLEAAVADTKDVAELSAHATILGRSRPSPRAAAGYTWLAARRARHGHVRGARRQQRRATPWAKRRRRGQQRPAARRGIVVAKVAYLLHALMVLRHGWTL